VFEAREAVRLEREAAEQAVRDFENARLAMVDYFWDRIVTKGHAAKFGEEAEVRDFTSSWITDEQVRAYQENTNNLPRFIDLQRAWEAHVRSQDPKYLLAQEFNEVAGQFGKTAPQSMAELAVLIVEAGRFVEAHPELESSQTGRLKKNI